MRKLLGLFLALWLVLPGTVAFADTTVIGGGSGGVLTSSDCDTSAYYAIGTLCQDTDDGKLYKGTGIAVAEITAGSPGDVASDALWDTKGDLAVGTGANTAGKLAVGTAYQILHTATDTPGWTSTLGATGTRLTKGWFTDLEVTNAIAGAITGNAATATALAADPANCAAGQIALGVTAAGVAECTAEPTGLTSVTATTFVGALTGNASTATALAADPADCTNQFARGVAASGAAACASVAAADITNNTITTTQLAAALTFAEGDLIDLSAITHSAGADEGLILPNWADVSPTSDKKFLAVDGSNLKLYNGGWVTIGATGAPTDASYLTLGLNGTTSAERVLTEGLAIDFTDGGANSTLTVAFDPLEFTGNRTWAAGGAASITWTWDNTGTDPTLTFGDDLISTANSFTIATGKNLTVGTTQWNSADEIDGTKIKDADYGDVTVSAAGAWAVEDDSHAHGSTTITLASTNLSDTATLAYLAGAQTFTANNVFGNADTDTLTLRSMIIGGNSREVQINAGARTAPTYPSASPTQDLYIKGNVETPGNLYAASFTSTSAGDSYITLGTNAGGLALAANAVAFDVDVLKWRTSAAGEKTFVNLEDNQTFAGSNTFTSVQYFGSAAATGSFRIYDGSDHYAVITMPSIAANYTLTLPTTDGASGQYLKTDGSGALSWDAPTATAHGSDTFVQFNDGGSALGSDAGFTFTKASSLLLLGKDTVDGQLKLFNDLAGGDGSATIAVNAAQTASSDITLTLPAATGTLAILGANTFTGNQLLDDGSGASPSLTFQDATDETAVFSKVDAGYLTLTTDATDGLNILTGNLKVGNGSPGQTINGEDVYIEGLVEIDGVLYADGGATIGGAFTVAAATSSIPVVVGTGTASGVTAAGQMYFESDTEILTIGDGATSIGLDMAPNVVYTFPAATSTLARSDAGQTFTGVQAFTAPTVATSIAPNTAANASLGTTLLPFSSVFIGDAATNNVQLINTAAAGAVVLTLPSTTGTLYGSGSGTITSAELLGSLTNETGTGVAVFGTAPTFTTKITTPLIDLGAGISLTGGAGIATFTDLAGTSEVLALDLRTENTAKWTTSSGVTKLDIGALNLVTTGTVQAGVTISSDADGMDAAAMTAAGVSGTMFIATGAGTWILPRAVLGNSLCLMDSGTAHDLILDVTAGSTIRLKGTEQADGVGITNASGTSTGDFICVVAVATDKWSTVGMQGTWASQ